MAVRFILGRAGSGKTRRCLDEILAALADTEADEPLLLLVPEQASFQMERALVARAPAGGFWRAQVLSFSRLAQRLLADGPATPPMLRPVARLLALRRIAAREPQLLAAFGKSAAAPGFFAQLETLIEELLSENVTPDRLAQAAERLEQPARTRAVAALYERYLAWLEKRELSDPAQQLALLRQRCEGLEWLRRARVWVDGFAGFTGQEFETLIALARVVREMHISLLLDPEQIGTGAGAPADDVLRLFQRTEHTYRLLSARLREEGVALERPLVLDSEPPPRFCEPLLARLEAGFTGRRLRATVLRRGEPGRSPVRVVACATHRDELRAAARWIRQQVCRPGSHLRWRDFAVVARSLDRFADDVTDVFAEYGIPCFVDRRRALRSHALARLVPTLLEAVAEDLPTATMVRLLRCRLAALERDQSERLEAHLLEQALHGWQSWQEPWRAGGALEEQRRRLVAALEPLRALALAERPAARLWAERLYGALVALGVERTIADWIAQARAAGDHETGEFHRLAWDTLCELLDDLVAVLDDEPLSAAELAGLVAGELHELSVGLAPPTLDQVLVGSIERTRHPDVKYVWVIGLNEGLFPAVPPDDHLLSTDERLALREAGLAAPKPRRDEAFAERMLAYIALTRPSHGLVVSYAQRDAAGEALYPSPYVSDLLSILPQVQPEEVAPPAAAGGDVPASMPELARVLIDARAAGGAAAAVMPAVRAALAGRPELRARLDELLRGCDYTNEPAPVADYAISSAGGEQRTWAGSPSQLETYLRCPFQHFARYGLRLSEPPRPTPAAQHLGSLAHAVLARVVGQAIAAGLPAAKIDDAQWLAWLEQALADELADQQADLERNRPDLAFMRDTLRRTLSEVVLVHAERWRRGRFEPRHCELQFGRTRARGHSRGERLAAFELDLPRAGRLRISGFVDRVDVCRTESGTLVAIYDYKPSPKSLAAEWLADERLQIFTYLLAVADLWPRQPATAVGVFLAPLYPDLTPIGRKYWDGADESTGRMYLYRPRGLFRRDCLPLMDARVAAGERSAVVNVRLKKDGQPEARGDADDPEVFAARLELARRTLRYAAEGLLAGRVDVAPLYERKTLACRNCVYRTVCRFELDFNRPRVAERTLPTLSQVLAEPAGGQS